MQNQLPQSLQNLLNNQSKKINLITDEIKNFEVSDQESNNFENIFTILTVFLIGILAFLTYFNMQKNTSLIEKNYQLKKIVLQTLTIQDSPEEIQSKIDTLTKLKNLKNSLTKNSSFFDFLALLSKNIQNDTLISLNYEKKDNSYQYEIIVNSNDTNFENNFLRFFKEKYPSQKIEKATEIQIPNTNTKQYNFKGTYEL